ncbi:hypothetical protein Nepgr_009639 [Nepenthes gracilis]|uniref:Kinesin-like protein n=1 Tax=Nepenthes gracilis TaxID=150966 RepID=A0AAD3XKJ0_NEPGR|nr:hypothetical protein Nepgr_009639 [Nepenthes gracilis]
MLTSAESSRAKALTKYISTMFRGVDDPTIDIFSLSGCSGKKLQIHESLERGIFVAGLREEIVNDSEQVLSLLQAGEINRHFAGTNTNVRSSESHTIFRIVIESKRNKVDSSNDYSRSNAIRVSVLNLVDLAGSEGVAKTGADRVLLKEGKHINKSLMVLAPEEVHIEETKGTLQFANRAECITNCAQVNKILTDAALLKRQKLEIEELRKQLQGSRAEVLKQENLKLRNSMLKYELERKNLAMELEQERKLHQQRDQCIKEQQMKIDNLSHLVNFSDADQNRFNYSKISDSILSPLPITLSNVVDEDAWVKLNEGYVVVQAQVSQMITTKELQNLRKRLELATKDKHELELEQKLHQKCDSGRVFAEVGVRRFNKLQHFIKLFSI